MLQRGRLVFENGSSTVYDNIHTNNTQGKREFATCHVVCTFNEKSQRTSLPAQRLIGKSVTNELYVRTKKERKTGQFCFRQFPI